MCVDYFEPWGKTTVNVRRQVVRNLENVLGYGKSVVTHKSINQWVILFLLFTLFVLHVIIYKLQKIINHAQ